MEGEGLAGLFCYTESVLEKLCLICALEKPVSDFYYREGTPESYCKECKKFKVNPDRLAGIERRKQRNQEMREANAEAKALHSLVIL